MADTVIKNWKTATGGGALALIIGMLFTLLTSNMVEDGEQDARIAALMERVTTVEKTVNNAIEHIAKPALSRIEANSVAVLELMKTLHIHELRDAHPGAAVELKNLYNIIATLRHELTTVKDDVNEKQVVLLKKQGEIIQMLGKIQGRMEKQ